MNWWALTKLHELYDKRSTPAVDQFIKDNTIKYLLNTGELAIDGKCVIVDEYSSNTFINYYESSHLQNYIQFNELLIKYELKKPQSRYDETELKILVELDDEMRTGSIASVRQQIIDQEESIRGVSKMFFKSEKYLDNKEDVVDALKKVLKIDQLANDKPQQWIYKLTHPTRKLIVLCENLDFLRRPTKPLNHNIELWYAGGWNTPKLERERPLIDKPIYYICDWDHDGLYIYLDIKDILPTIQLLTPTAAPIKLADSPDHDSTWVEKDLLLFAGLADTILSKPQKQLVHDLIKNKAWIREEDNKLIEMLISNRAFQIFMKS